MPDLVLVTLLSVMRAKPWAKRPIHMYRYYFLNHIYIRQFIWGSFLVRDYI